MAGIIRAMKSEAIDITIAAVGSKTTYGGAGVSVVGFLLSNQFFGLMGVAIALAGLLMNLYYKRKADRRLVVEAEHRRQERQLRMDLMRVAGAPFPQPERETDLGALEEDE